MRILIVNKFYYLSGGVERYVFDLQKELERQGHEVAIFSMQDERNVKTKYEKYFVKNVDFAAKSWLKRIYFGIKSIYSWEARKKMGKILDDFKPDVVHLNSICFQLTSSIIGPIKKRGIRIVQTLHEYKLICPNQRLFNFSSNEICEKCYRHKYYQPFFQKCLKESRLAGILIAKEAWLSEMILHYSQKVDLFIAPSKFMQTKCQQWGIPKNKFKHLPYLVNPANLKPSESVGNGLAYFGRLSAEKGIMTLLGAMKELPDIELKIIGNGPQKDEIAAYIKENKLLNVKLLGFRNNDPLYDLIRQCRLVIVPSIWHENYPLAVLEAFSLAKPVIASQIGGLPELVKNGETGYLFKPGDSHDLAVKIKNCYSNRELIESMGQKARGLVMENCDPKKHVEALVRLYKEGGEGRKG